MDYIVNNMQKLTYNRNSGQPKNKGQIMKESEKSLSLSEKVDKVFRSCLFQDNEIIEGKPIVKPVEVRGIISKYGFHPERILQAEKTIIDMLSNFSDDFYADGGGGMSFLNFCMTKDGRQWAEHPTMEMLVVLGIAIDKVRYAMPRDMWEILPGGMPYIIIDRKSEVNHKTV